MIQLRANPGTEAIPQPPPTPSSARGPGSAPRPGKQLRDHSPARGHWTTDTPSLGPDTSPGPKHSFSGPNAPFLELDPRLAPIFLLWPTARSSAGETAAPSLAAMQRVTAGAPTFSPPCHHKLGSPGTMFSPWLSATRSKSSLWMWGSNKALAQQRLPQRADLQLLAASRDVSAWWDPPHTVSE